MVLVYGGCEEELGVTGYIFLVNGGAVSWRSCKQSLMAQSTKESEYMDAAKAANEGVWLRKFAIELGVFPNMRDHVNIFCDNSATYLIPWNSGLTP
jgi:hypothetical protein